MRVTRLRDKMSLGATLVDISRPAVRQDTHLYVCAERKRSVNRSRVKLDPLMYLKGHTL